VRSAKAATPRVRTHYCEGNGAENGNEMQGKARKALRPRALTMQAEARFRVPSGYGQSACQQRCKRLKTVWFPARLRLVSSQLAHAIAVTIMGSDPTYLRMPVPAD
jgi:hypothetical protein